MADLGLREGDLPAFFYYDELSGLRECFETALAAMHERRSRASAALAEYERFLAEGGTWEGERDEDGGILWSREDALSIVEFNAYLALDTLREAFVTSLFHFWERSAREWTGLHGPRHNFKALSAAVAERHPISDGLPALNELNNLLKHDNPDRALDLAMLRPDLFRFLPSSEPGSRRVSWALGLTTAHVQGFFEIVKASGPVYARPLPQDRL